MRSRLTILLAIALLAVPAAALAAATGDTDSMQAPSAQVAQPAPAPVDTPIQIDPVEPLPDPIQIDPVEPLPDPIQIDPVEPQPLPGIGALPLEGDVILPGQTVNGVLFSLFWDEEDPAHVQLWALWNENPILVCDGRVQPGPVFVGQSELVPGTCVIGQTTSADFPLTIVGDDGGWLFSVLHETTRTIPVDPLD